MVCRLVVWRLEHRHIGCHWAAQFSFNAFHTRQHSCSKFLMYRSNVVGVLYIMCWSCKRGNAHPHPLHHISSSEKGKMVPLWCSTSEAFMPLCFHLPRRWRLLCLAGGHQAEASHRNQRPMPERSEISFRSYPQPGQFLHPPCGCHYHVWCVWWSRALWAFGVIPPGADHTIFPYQERALREELGRGAKGSLWKSPGGLGGVLHLATDHSTSPGC